MASCNNQNPVGPEGPLGEPGRLGGPSRETTMKVAGHWGGGASILKRYRLSGSILNAGIVAIYAPGAVSGVLPSTTTSFADSPGLALDTGTYSTTQSATVEGTVTIDIRPDAIISAKMSGGATENTVLTTLSNTSADTTGLIVTDADVGTNTSLYGTVWCIGGGNVGQSRTITAFNSAVDIRVVVPFTNTIAVGDTFLWAPYNVLGASVTYVDNGNLQTSTLFTQADASIAGGTGGAVSIWDLELNGVGDSNVLFLLGDHIHRVYTT